MGVSQGPDHVRQTILSARTPRFANPQLGQRQLKVVANDQQVLVCDFIKILGRRHAAATAIHERVWSQQEAADAGQFRLHYLTLKL